MERIQDAGESVWSFVDDILVRCPSCAGPAHVIPRGVLGALVGASVREREREARARGEVVSNSTLLAKLPRWMKAAKNRDAVDGAPRRARDLKSRLAHFGSPEGSGERGEPLPTRT